MMTIIIQFKQKCYVSPALRMTWARILRVLRVLRVCVERAWPRAATNGERWTLIDANWIKTNNFRFNLIQLNSISFIVITAHTTVYNISFLSAAPVSPGRSRQKTLIFFFVLFRAHKRTIMRNYYFNGEICKEKKMTFFFISFCLRMHNGWHCFQFFGPHTHARALRRNEKKNTDRRKVNVCLEFVRLSNGTRVNRKQ